MDIRRRTMKTIQVILCLFATCSIASGMQQGPIIIENAHMRYMISAEGKNLGFLDLTSRTEYLKHDRPSVCAMVRRGGIEYQATSAVLENGRLTIEFSEANAKAVIRVESKESYIRLTVENISGDNIESLVFLNIPLTLHGRPDEPFGSCALYR